MSEALGSSSVDFSPRGKLLALRLFRLGHIPPAQYGTQILFEKGVPVLVAEFGHISEKQLTVAGSPPRIRIQARWVGLLPRKLAPYLLFLNAFFQLAFRFVIQGRPAHLIAHGVQEECLAGLLSFFSGLNFLSTFTKPTIRKISIILTVFYTL